VGDQVLDQKRQAGERAVLRRHGLSTRLLEAALDHGVESAKLDVEVLCPLRDPGVDVL